MKKILSAVSATAASLVYSAGTLAAAVPIDLVDVTAQFGELNTAQIGIGGLLMIAAVIAVGYKWGKAMLFG